MNLPVVCRVSYVHFVILACVWRWSVLTVSTAASFAPTALPILLAAWSRYHLAHGRVHLLLVGLPMLGTVPYSALWCMISCPKGFRMMLVWYLPRPPP